MLAVGVCFAILAAAGLAAHAGSVLLADGRWLPPARQLVFQIPMWSVLSPWGLIVLRKLHDKRTHDQIGINLILYMSLPASLVWLWAAGQPIPNPHIMAASASLIVTAAVLGGFTAKKPNLLK